MDDTKRKDRILSFAVFFAALLSRLALTGEMRGSVLFQSPLLDAEYYDLWARAISAGDWLGGTGVYPMSPGYPYALAVIYRTFGRSLGFVALLQSLLGALSCVLVYRIARRFLNPWAAALAGLLLAFSGVSIFYSNMLLKAVWIEALNAGFLFLLLKAQDTPKPWPWISAGLCLGLSAQFRPNALILVPVVFGVAWFLEKSQRRRAVTAFLAGLLLTLAPTAIRNRAVAGEWALSTSHGGMNFFTGNNPRSAAPYRPLPFARSDPQFEQSDFLAEARRRAGAPLSPAQASRFWYAEAFRFIRTSPVDWLKLTAKKFVLLWNDYEQPINQNYYFFRDQFQVLKAFSWIGFGCLAPLGLLGMALTWKKREYFLLRWYTISYAAGLVLIFSVSEYRHPLTLALAVFAASAVAWAVETFRTEQPARVKKLAAAGIFLILLAVFVQRPTPEQLGAQDDLAVAYNNLGSIHMSNSEYEKALQALERSLALSPGYADPLYNMGETYGRIKNPQKAVECLEAAMRSKPGFVPGHYESKLGLAYAQLNRFDEAKTHFLKSLEYDPEDPETLHNLSLTYFCTGNSLAQAGRFREAAADFEQAVRYNPSFLPAQENLQRARKLYKP